MRLGETCLSKASDYGKLLCYYFWNSDGDVVNEGIDLFQDRFNNSKKGPENPTESHVVRCETFQQLELELEFPEILSQSLTECVWKLQNNAS